MNKLKNLFLVTILSLVLFPFSVASAVDVPAVTTNSSDPQVQSTQVGSNPAGAAPAATATTTTESLENTRVELRAANTAKKAEIATQRATLIAQKAALNSVKCAAVEAKIALQIARYEAKLLERETFFHRFSKRVSSIILNLDKSGYDTTKLKADQIVLDQKITQYSADKTAYILLLKESRSYTCGKSEGEFRSKLLDAKESLNKAKISNLDVREYYHSTIRPDIMALKSQVKASKTTTSNQESTTSAGQAPNATSQAPELNQ